MILSLKDVQKCKVECKLVHLCKFQFSQRKVAISGRWVARVIHLNCCKEKRKQYFIVRLVILFLQSRVWGKPFYFSTDKGAVSRDFQNQILCCANSTVLSCMYCIVYTVHIHTRIHVTSKSVILCCTVLYMKLQTTCTQLGDQILIYQNLVTLSL